MLSKSQASLIRSLKYKKFRKLHGLFVAEGEKIVNDLIKISDDKNNLFKIRSIYGTSGWFSNNKKLKTADWGFVEITEEELKRISMLTTPNKVLALVRIPDYMDDTDHILKNLSLVLDDIQDPGNLGTIIRIAHWFGITHVICSENSADLFNPKTIQSAMGSIWSVRVLYRALPAFLKYYNDNTDLPVIGAFLSGSDIYTQSPVHKGLIVLGNESRGISKDLEPFIRSRIYIPPFSEESRPDSINVAIAAAIICSELRRNAFTQNESTT
jgi:TrmH family RNA methyltransferase